MREQELYDEFALLEQANKIYKNVCDNKEYNDQTREYLIVGVNLFRLASVYKKCIDNLFSGDCSEKEFIKAIKLGSLIALQEDSEDEY